MQDVLAVDNFLKELADESLKQQVMFLTIKCEIMEKYFKDMNTIDGMLIDNLHKRLCKLEEKN